MERAIHDGVIVDFDQGGGLRQSPYLLLSGLFTALPYAHLLRGLLKLLAELNVHP
jgi:hypothetical protein